MRSLASITLAVALVSGCASRSLRLALIDASVQRPSNIAVYFTVDTADGEPVPGLDAKAFKIYEDDQPVSALEAKQTILNAEVSATHYTLLLVDMSGSITASGDVPAIAEAVRGFTERVQSYQKVAIYAFDGAVDIRAIAGFGAGAGADQLAAFKSRDPSTNLNGAIVEAMKLLHRQLASAPTPLAFGTLVVFTDGTDRAHRVERDKLYDALDEADVDIVIVGVGAEIDASELRSIGRNGAILSKDRAQIAASFAAAAARVEAMSKRYYLLGYCSPARAGEHVVRIETTANGRSGSYEYRFDARGFGPNCDPTRAPAFSLKRPKPRVSSSRH